MSMQKILHALEHPDEESPTFIEGTTRNDLAQAFSYLNLKRGAEIGVEAGLFSTVLLDANPALHLYCIDCWRGYDLQNDYKPKNYGPALKEKALRNLKGRAVSIVDDFSINAVQMFKDRSFDFVYIDANHEYPFVVQDIYYWAQKVKVGGIVAGHDCLDLPDRFFHVRSAVEGYVRSFHIEHWFMTDEAYPTWFWVKS